MMRRPAYYRHCLVLAALLLAQQANCWLSLINFPHRSGQHLYSHTHHHRPQPSSLHQASVRCPQGRMHMCAGPSPSRKPDQLPPGATLIEGLKSHTTRQMAARQLLLVKGDLPSEALTALVVACSRLGNMIGCRDAIAILRERGTPMSPGAYEEAFKVAAARLHVDVVNTLVHELLMDGITPTVTQLSVTLSLTIRAERVGQALGVFKLFQSTGAGPPSVKLIKPLFHLITRKGQKDSLKKAVSLLTSMGAELDTPTSVLIVGALATCGDYERMNAVMASLTRQSKEEEGSSPESLLAQTYASAVSGLLRAGAMEEGRRMYEEAVGQAGVVMGPKAFDGMISASITTSDLDTALFYVNERRRQLPGLAMEPRMYKGITGLCFTEGRLAEAMRVMRWYAEETEERDRGMFNRLLRSLARSGEVDGEMESAVLSLWFDVLSPRGFVGDAYTYLQLIKRLSAREAWPEVIMLYNEAKNANVALWIVAVSHVMTAYIRQDQPEAALELVEPFLRRGPPDAQRASSGELLAWDVCLSRACLLLTRDVTTLSLASVCLEGLKKQPVTSPYPMHPVGYLRLIQAFGAAQSPEQALEVVALANRRDKTLLSKESESATRLYNAVIGAFAESKQLVEAMEVMKKMKQKDVAPSPVTYTILLSACDGRDDGETVKELLSLMKKDGVQPDTYLATTVIALTSNMRNRTWAEELQVTMQPYITEPTAVSYGAQIVAKGQLKGQTSLAEIRALLEEAKAKQLVDCEAPYVEVLRLLYKGVMQDQTLAQTSLELLEEMVSLGITAGPLSYRWVFKSLKQAMRYDDIIKLAEAIPRQWLVYYPRLAIPVVVAYLRMKNQTPALELVNDVILAGSGGSSTSGRGGITYDTYRWAMRVYCLKADPPQVEAAEEVLEMVIKSLTPTGSKEALIPDRGFYYYLLTAYGRVGDFDRVIEVYQSLPKRYQGGDGAAVAARAYSAVNRPDMLPGMIRAITKGTGIAQEQAKQPELITPDVLVELIVELAAKGEWGTAREVLEILLGKGSLTSGSVAEVETAVEIIKSSAEGRPEAQEVVDGLELLILSVPSRPEDGR